MDFFAEQGRVIAYDQIPYGLSEKLVAGDWTEGNPYSSDAAVDQLFSFRDALDVGNLDSVLPNSELVILHTCGHVPQEECPEAFKEAVDAWLSR